VSGAGSIAANGNGAARRSRWSAMLRIGFEFALLFGVAVVAKQIVAAAATGSYPNPLWLPVIVLSLQHGMAAGLGAAIVAAGLQYWDGLPPPLMSEDMYAYIGRIAAEPVGWTLVALLIGHIRSRQIANQAELEAELAERNSHSAAVADLCVDLRARTEMLERHIAANAPSSNIDVAEVVSELAHASWENFSERLTRYVRLMTGVAEFSVHLRRGHALAAAFQPEDEHHIVADVAPDDPLFAAIVEERRTLSAARSGDRALLGDRGIMAGPLIDPNASSRVIGMLAIGAASGAGTPEDLERRFAFTAAEVARLADRIGLFERWRSAAAPIRSNGHALQSNGHGAAAARSDTTPGVEPATATNGRGSALPSGRPLSDKEFTLR
jgi:polysaccharide biosynthesis protein PelD